MVGDLAGNARMVIERTREAAGAGAHLVSFPEMVLTGYPIEDLALRWSFQQASIAALDSLAVSLADAGLGEIAVIVGYLDLRDGGRDHPLGTPRGAPINAAAVLHGGAVVARYAKHHLPNYGVFDEFRYFVSGTEPCVVRVHGVDVAVAICEDLWQPVGRWPRCATSAPGCWWSSTARPTRCTRTTPGSSLPPSGPLRPTRRWPT